MFVFYFEGITGGNNILLLQRRGKNRSRISAHQNFPVVGCCDTIVSSHRKCFMLLDWCVWDCSHVSAVHTAVNKTTVTDTTADVQPFVWKTKLTTGKKHVLTKAISQNIILNINIEFHKWCIVVVVYFFPAWWLFRPLRPRSFSTQRDSLHTSVMFVSQIWNWLCPEIDFFQHLQSSLINKFV